ncbi:Aste57867_17871 [Aphanomyces stellatus]|uniref:Aste57867_17871 protein n=1 Tax=Aphanomyces stellatus TaxID=120398 RepID=A0A485L9I4_9STRA|nr:hypothetical protein As57867_017810 [Aphanomyces stellatus]VFT94614.1 Aste57867_17871 [Aphanomyces stellatus]
MSADNNARAGSSMISDATYATREILVDARDIDAEEVDPKVRKRLYNRQKLRDVRRQEKEELTRLRAEVQACTERVLAHPRLLPWKDIADELRQGLIATNVRNQDLKQAAARLWRILQVLVPWTQTMPSAAVASLLPHQSDWRQHALLGATGDVRVMSYKWITERLYHNTAMALAQYERGDEGLVSLVECRDDAMAYVVIRDPRVCSATLEDVTEAQRRIYCKLPPSNRLDHEFLEAAFGANADIVHTFSGDGELSGVARLFVDETRSVLVTTHVAVDASTRGHVPANDNTVEGWIVNDRLSETLTRVREYWVMGFPALASRDAYAAVMHVDVSTLQTKTDDDIYQTYSRLMRQAVAGQLQHCRAMFYETLAQVQGEKSPGTKR